MLRRNIGRGEVIEGIQVRWWLVAQILQALTEWGPYRLDGSEGPMHKYYDPRLFDMRSESELKEELAPKDGSGQAMDVRTGAGLLEAGFDVRLIGEAGEEASGAEAAGAGGDDASAAAARRP